MSPLGAGDDLNDLYFHNALLPNICSEAGFRDSALRVFPAPSATFSGAAPDPRLAVPALPEESARTRPDSIGLIYFPSTLVCLLRRSRLPPMCDNPLTGIWEVLITVCQSLCLMLCHLV